MKLIQSLLNPTPEDLAKRQLRQARMELLETEAALEYHAGMADALRKRVARLGGTAEVPNEAATAVATAAVSRARNVSRESNISR